MIYLSIHLFIYFLINMKKYNKILIKNMYNKREECYGMLRSCIFRLNVIWVINFNNLVKD